MPRTSRRDTLIRQEQSLFACGWNYWKGQVYAARDEADPAFEWLERAYARRDPGLAEMKSSPRFRSLHGDPRWAAFLQRMGFEE